MTRRAPRSSLSPDTTHFRSLNVGETWHYTAFHTLLQSEIDSNGGGGGKSENKSTAGRNQTGPDTYRAVLPMFFKPALKIIKDPVPGPPSDTRGRLLSYTVIS